MNRGSGTGRQRAPRAAVQHGFFFLLALTLAAAVCGPAPSGSVATAAESVADWTLETADGDAVNFHTLLAEGPVVISFWATWCKPCLKELPELDRIAGSFAGRVTFLAVNADNSKSVAKVAPYLKAHKYDNLVVPLDTGAELQQLLQVGGTIPFTVVFDANGREFYRHVGYKKGDEVELQHEVARLLAGTDHGAAPPTTAKPGGAEAVTASDKFKYSYSSETKREILENWLDVSYQFGGFRTGLMLQSMAPSEYGERTNNIEHRFFEFATGGFNVRAGHFYGIFGRGLIFNGYEDRVVRVDTRLDGLSATYNRGRIAAAAFSGTPSDKELDIRAADLEVTVVGKLRLGATGMTYRPDDHVNADDTVRREWVTSGRIRQSFGFGDYYFEYGWKKGWDYDPLNDMANPGRGMYGNLNLYRGPFSVSYETSDYDRFAVVKRADGGAALNRPPSLAREFTWTLLNRSPHNLNADDERGNNLDLLYADTGGLSLLASGARIENQAGELVYESAFGSIQADHLGAWKLTGGFGYQDSEGLRQTVVGEVVWRVTSTHSWTLQAEHQHVRLGGGHGFDLGAYDQQWFKVEYETAPLWAFTAILETNNKYDEHRGPNEQKGPFPAGQISYTIRNGGNLNLWFGKRQAGYLCSGGVCKLEPAFEGVEIFGVFRY